MQHLSFRSRCVRAVMAIAIGGTAFQLSGCDPNVRSTVLTGLEATSTGLTSTLITALFQSLEDDNAGGSLTTTP